MQIKTYLNKLDKEELESYIMEMARTRLSVTETSGNIRFAMPMTKENYVKSLMDFLFWTDEDYYHQGSMEIRRASQFKRIMVRGTRFKLTSFNATRTDSNCIVLTSEPTQITYQIIPEEGQEQDFPKIFHINNPDNWKYSGDKVYYYEKENGVTNLRKIISDIRRR